MTKTAWTALLVASMAGVALMYPILKTLGNSVDPLLLSFFRFAIAAAALLPLVLYRKSLALPPARDLALFAFIAACSVFPTALLAIGIGYTNSIVGAILMNSNPLIIALLSPIIISERVNGAKFAALAVGFLGVVAVVLNGHNPLSLAGSAYFLGTAILLLAALLGALSKIYSKDLVRKYDGLYVTFFALVFGSLILALIETFRSGFAAVALFTPSTLLLLFAIGTVCTAVPWTVWNSSLKHLDVHVAASFSLLIPIFAAAYSFLLFTEAFTIWMLAGLVLTSIGIYFVQRPEKIAPNV